MSKSGQCDNKPHIYRDQRENGKTIPRELTRISQLLKIR